MAIGGKTGFATGHLHPVLFSIRPHFEQQNIILSSSNRFFSFVRVFVCVAFRKKWFNFFPLKAKVGDLELQKSGPGSYFESVYDSRFV